MSKDFQRKTAETYFVELGKTSKEISVLTGISEQTLSRWRNRYNWDDLRTARLCKTSIRTDNIRQIINNMADERIRLTNDLKSAEAKSVLKEITEIRERIAAIDDGISKWNKTFENVIKDNKIHITDHVSIFEKIFNALRSYNENLYLSTIDFQENYMQNLMNDVKNS
jgi:transposase